MKYTLDDIKALANVEKKIVENDRQKKEDKINECRNGINFAKLFELDNMLMELAKGLYIDDYAKYYTDTSMGSFCLTFMRKKLFISKFNYGGMCSIHSEPFCEIERINFVINFAEEQIQMYEWIARNFDEICKVAEDRIEELYEQKLNNVLNIANKEY